MADDDQLGGFAIPRASATIKKNVELSNTNANLNKAVENAADDQQQRGEQNQIRDEEERTAFITADDALLLLGDEEKKQLQQEIRESSPQQSASDEAQKRKQLSPLPSPQQDGNDNNDDDDDENMRIAHHDAIAESAAAAPARKQPKQKNNVNPAAPHRRDTLVFGDNDTLESFFGAHFHPSNNAFLDKWTLTADANKERNIQLELEQCFGAALAANWVPHVFLHVMEGEDSSKDSVFVEPALLPFSSETGVQAIKERLAVHRTEQNGILAVDRIKQLFGPAALPVIAVAVKQRRVGGAGVADDGAHGDGDADEDTGRGKRQQQEQIPRIISLPRIPVASVPPPSAAAAKKLAATSFSEEADTWLLHLPSMSGNRRSLHIDGKPYDPKYPEAPMPSTERAIYTPLNVMRWAHDLSRDVDLSNARLVKWSSGSWTLHIGSDVYAVASDKTASLVVVGEEHSNRKLAEFAPFGLTSAGAENTFIETAPYVQRAQLLPLMTDDVTHSIESFLVAENRLRGAKGAASGVRLVSEQVIVSKPAMPGQPKTKELGSARFIDLNADTAKYINDNEKMREQQLRANKKGGGNGGAQQNPTLYDRLRFDAQVLEEASKIATGGHEAEALIAKRMKELALLTEQTQLRNKNASSNNAAAAGRGFGKGKKERDTTLVEGAGVDESDADAERNAGSDDDDVDDGNESKDSWVATDDDDDDDDDGDEDDGKSRKKRSNKSSKKSKNKDNKKKKKSKKEKKDKRKDKKSKRDKKKGDDESMLLGALGAAADDDDDPARVLLLPAGTRRARRDDGSDEEATGEATLGAVREFANGLRNNLALGPLESADEQKIEQLVAEAEASSNCSQVLRALRKFGDELMKRAVAGAATVE